MALFGDRPRSASAQALDETELLIIDKDTFRSLLKDPMIMDIFVEMSKRIREVDDKLEKLSIQDHLRKEHLSSLATQRRWFV